MIRIMLAAMLVLLTPFFAQGAELASYSARYGVKFVDGGSSGLILKHGSFERTIRIGCPVSEFFQSSYLELARSGTAEKKIITDEFSGKERADGSYLQERDELIDDLRIGAVSQMSVSTHTVTLKTPPHEHRTFFFPLEATRAVIAAAQSGKTTFSFTEAGRKGKALEATYHVDGKIEANEQAFLPLLRRPGWVIQRTSQTIQGQPVKSSMVLLDNGVSTQMLVSVAGTHAQLTLTDIKQIFGGSTCK